ncbi:protein virilizer isoform X2 [Zeugodacus cucurbitae]|uniref:Protein virilizer n=1 Tax=Zeugodacus cucurbitae TaxID=28588 RepID=A0A0A1WT78_ZEUCU|nr:protein virilizer isoform X2 [Zeugodacus cucurbitae]
MVETDDAAELLFFDTFSHEVDTDINLDLVQFPKPVFITQVRIIPLGARVQADFPGGVRLGATNPSKFDIEFFVNDLGMPGASTFENLGQLKYNQNDCIHLECTQEKIPTDGLVLRGWYSTITLAVYGILTNSMNEPIASPPPPPCEPTGPEEICNLSGSGETREPSIPEETSKDEWKEPLPSEVPTAHKTNLSDFERDDLEYGVGRSGGGGGEHYQHSGDERERGMRKTSHSSERSLPSRNRTHSESNERDYVRSRSEREREKVSRDWSRSPEYTRHSRRKRSERSRSDAEESHKWPPRTPPASIDSPTRPRSPDNMEYSEDDVHYKLKSRSYMRSDDSLTNGAPDTQPLDDDETPGTPGEQYEPILSDDEIIGDDDSNNAIEQVMGDDFEAELLAAANAAGPAIHEFDPFTMPIKRYDSDLQALYHKEVDTLFIIMEKFDVQTKCESVSAFNDATTTIEERENFVYLSEQLINHLSYIWQNFKRRNFVLKKFFTSDAKYLIKSFNILKIALEFESACLQQQPAFKIRHIKIGARLTELFASAPQFLAYLLQTQNFDPFAALFTLYQEKYMAVSIKLMLLKAIYALLGTKEGIRHFLVGGKLGGYQLLFDTLKESRLTRTKFALQAIVKKLHLYEALECVRESCSKLFVLTNYTAAAPAEQYVAIERAIEQIMDALTYNSLSYQQPKRFLPVSKKFEIAVDTAAQRSFANDLQSYFVLHTLGESLLLLLVNANALPPSLLLRVLDLLQAMLQTHVGVDYLVDDCFETTRLLIAVLLGTDDVPADVTPTEEEDYEMKVSEEATQPKPESDSVADAIKKTENDGTPTTKADAQPKTKDTEEPAMQLETAALTKESTPATTQTLRRPLLHRLQQIGVELAYKVQTRYHLDAVMYLTRAEQYDIINLATHLHALYSQTCQSHGRQHTVEVIGMNNNMQFFMDLIQKEQRLQAQRQLASPGTKYKSPVLSYAVDMVDCCVRHCEQLDYLIEHGQNIFELAKNHETFEPSVSAVLQELFVFLKPSEAIHIFAYDNITPLVEVITRSMEYITTFPGDLIMGLRILRHLAIGSNSKAFRSSQTEELKHRFVTLQFYAADGVQTIMQILEKLCSYFEQPGLHTPALMTLQGLHCCQIILPALQVLRAMLSFAIQCRDAEFKDLTAIDHLMKAYFLLHYYPAGSQAAPAIAEAKQEIIQIFLAYTQPNEQDEESLHKSLWTQMIREILKNIDGPSTFIPGLHVLAELLPLPLPMPLPADAHVPESQSQRLITERKLWSAHLHPLSAQIAKLIETIAPTTFTPLLDLMTKVCLQLADLAPNMTLLVSKTLSDMLCAEWQSASSTPTAQLARLLNFFARLTSFAALKISSISILNGKLWELFHSVLCYTGAASEVVQRAQLAIHNILRSFIDPSISFVSPKSIASPELNLAAALPTKELIPRIIEATLTNLFNSVAQQPVCEAALNNLNLLTELDITMHHLTQQLKHRRADFQQWLEKFLNAAESVEAPLAVIELLISFLHSLTHIAEYLQQLKAIPTRNIKLSTTELSYLLGYQKNASPTLMQRLSNALTKSKDKTPTQIKTEDECTSASNLLVEITTELDTIDGGTSAEGEDDSSAGIAAANVAEPTLPQSEGIVMQFAARPIFVEVDAVVDEPQLLTRYWLQVDCIDLDNSKYERVACDLTELAAECLTPETNLTSDCKRVLHLSASPQSNRERTPTAPCFRTRRVEVEPSTGRPEKKIYITPVRGRGFARAPPSRGDLFRSRPPNTSRPPSLHVDDFLALETCGAQPTGPTGYNKIPPIMRGSRVGRNRGSRISTAAAFRKSKVMRTASPSTWAEGGSPHYRSATTEPHFGDSHYSNSSHFSGRPRGRGGRPRPYLR